MQAPRQVADTSHGRGDIGHLVWSQNSKISLLHSHFLSDT